MISKPIYLCGMMGAGKSSVGPVLAEITQKPFADLDEIIVSSENRSIPEIFEEFGESYFRKCEKEQLVKCTKTFTGVLALGGGSLQNHSIVNLLKANGWLVYLHLPAEKLTERLSKSTGRPMLKGTEKKDKMDRITTLLNERKFFYKQAHFTIKTGTLTPLEIAKQIVTNISA